MIVRQLLTRLAFDADTKQAKQYGNALQTVRRVSVGLVAAKGALNAGLALFIRRMAAAGNETAKSAVEAGMAQDEYQGLRFVMERISQVSGPELDRALGNTNQRIQRASVEGGRYADSLMMLGFSQQEVTDRTITSGDAFDRVAELSRDAATQAEAAAAANALFGDRVARRLVPALQRADTDVDALRQSFRDLGGGLSEEALSASEDFVDSTTDLQAAITGVKSIIMEEMLPAITQSVQAFTEFIKENKELIGQRLHAALDLIVRSASFLWGMIRRVTTAVDNTVNRFTDWETVIRLVIAAFAAMIASGIIRWLTVTLTGALGTATAATRTLNAAIRTLRRLLLIGLFAAAIEDLHAWVNENESATGRVLGDWENFKQNLDAIWDDINNNPSQFFRILGMMIEDAARVLIDFNMAIQRHIEEIFRGWWESLLDTMPNWVQQMFGAGEVTSRSGPIGAMLDTFQDRREASTGSVTGGPPNQALSINSTVNLQVPEGTQSQQRDFLRLEAQQLFQRFWDREVRNAQFAIPGVD